MNWGSFLFNRLAELMARIINLEAQVTRLERRVKELESASYAWQDPPPIDSPPNE